jgi:5-deoxy-glucuronate isomerase
MAASTSASRRTDALVSDWFHRAGELAREGWDVVVDDTLPGWAHTGLRVGGTGEHELPAGALERMILPLEGDVTVVHAEGETTLRGRSSVFSGAADALYLGVGQSAALRVDGRVAVAEAPVTEPESDPLPMQVIRAADVPVEQRGGGAASRTVRNFGLPGALHAQKLLVCEVVTSAGNWSGVPPHKHDEVIPGAETRLEEIYWFDLAVARGVEQAADGAPVDPIGVFAAYDSPSGAIDLVELVRPGDVALVPHGYHGPAGAMPGYDLYYLNVMAGPDAGRAWRITDDPAHAWIRTTWTGTPS